MRALIVGSGVAGPVTAMALQRAGIDATIVDAHPVLDGEVGSYLTVTPNGLDALDAIDARRLAVVAGFRTRRNVMRNSAGRILGDVPLGAPLEDGTPALTVKRSRVSKLLAEEAIRRGITLELGRRMVSAETRDGSVLAAFDDGTTETADLLIGTDGVHSVVRRLIDPGAPVGRYVGLTNFGGNTRGASAVAAGIEPETWQFVFGRHAFFGYHRTPADDVVWFVNAPRDEIGAAERAGTSPDAWQRTLAGLFAEDRGPMVELIEHGELELAGDNTFDLPHVPTWHRGRMIVIGDAAHAPAPSSGQGASMAMEDGVLLAIALRDTGSIEAAFTAFEAARRDRVERIVAQGARSSSSKTPGRIGSAVRDVVLRLVFRFAVTERSMAWMYDARIRWDRPLTEQPKPGS
jgi:2-polyprenyl-6-methoxyphenol hydroxylase-like FAD-dependent oxidoreductase